MADDENNDPFDEFEDVFEDMSVDDIMVPSFGADVTYEESEATKVAIRTIKAANAVRDLADWLEENDVDLDEMRTASGLMEADPDEFVVVNAMSTYGQATDRLADVLEGDDTDDEHNPFRVK